MIPWQTVAATASQDGTRLSLLRRGTEWEVQADGFTLMSSRTHGSEDDLARLAFEAVPGAQAVLLGGLGLGFSLRATLDRLPRNGHVVVAELSPELCEWNRVHVGGLAGQPLDDPRVQVHVADVADRIAGGPGAWDAILLDVDNGPSALLHDANARLYGADGIARCFAALRAPGVLAAWATGPDDNYLRRLGKAGFHATARKVRIHQGRGGARHVVFVGVKATSGQPPTAPDARRRAAWGQRAPRHR